MTPAVPVRPPRNTRALRRAFAVLLSAGLLMTCVVRADDSPPSRAGAGRGAKGHSAPAVQHGVASYYSKRHEGRRTTSGEKYRADKLTAAHPDLPLGTLVRVVRPDTGHEVVVRVNDRCRRKKLPFIDLSRAAARQLGILGQGKAKVQIVRLDAEPDDTAQ